MEEMEKVGNRPKGDRGDTAVVDTAQDVASSTKSIAERAKDACDAGKKLAGTRRRRLGTTSSAVYSKGEKLMGGGVYAENKYDATKLTDDTISTSSLKPMIS